jgi:monoamine oxidase
MKDGSTVGVVRSRFNRRALLKVAGAGGLATALGTGRSSLSAARFEVRRQPPPDNASYDVVIVGGGVSGAYSGWRLLEDDPSLRVAVCEMSDRVGGRLFSVTPPGAPHLRAELGGMRLLNSQTQVVRLAEHLGLILVPFPLGDTRNLLYLRGRRWTQGDWGDPEKVPYVLRPDERGKSPNDLMQAVIERYVPDAADFSAADWRNFKQMATVQVNGIEHALMDMGFWNLLLATVSSEAYELIRDGGG